MTNKERRTGRLSPHKTMTFLQFLWETGYLLSLAAWPLLFLAGWYLHRHLHRQSVEQCERVAAALRKNGVLQMAYERLSTQAARTAAIAEDINQKPDGRA